MRDTQLADLAVNTEGNSFGALLDNGYIAVMDGDKPATGNTPVSSQNELVRLGFGSPAFRATEGGVVASNVLKSGVATRTGYPTWFRAFTADGDAVYDGTVGRGDNFNMKSPSEMIVEGMTVNCSGVSHSIAKSMAGI